MSIGSLEWVSIGLIAVARAISRAVSMAVTVVAVTVMAVTVAVARAIVASLNGSSEGSESKGFEHSRYKILFFILKVQLYLLYS